MALANYTRVKLISALFATEGAPFGSLGTIIETYDDSHYEVEFSDPKTGITFAQIVAAESDLTPL